MCPICLSIGTDADARVVDLDVLTHQQQSDR